MSELSELLAEINGAFAQIPDVDLPVVSESMSVGAYLAAMDALKASALAKADEAIALAIEAGRYVDTSGQIAILRGIREQLIDLHLQIHASLDPMASGSTLAEAWALLRGGDPGTTDPDPPPPPPDAVVLYGDTPMLLRAEDAPVPTAARFNSGAEPYVLTSPEIAIEPAGAWHIGSITGTGVGAAYELIKDATVGAVKGLLGEVIGAADSATLGLSFQAWEGYELGKLLTARAEKSIDFIGSGLAVLQGRKSPAEWDAEFNQHIGDTENELNTLATSTAVSKIPVVGWVLSPVVDAYRKFSYKLENTHSFEISVSSAGELRGGVNGGILLGGARDDYIVAGSGDVLATGGLGNDRFVAGSGNQYLFGSAGVDTLLHAGARGQQVLSRDGAALVVSGPLGRHVLLSVERLEFADRKLAFDFGAGFAAESAARLIGAALDKAGITPQLAGQALDLFDAGATLLQVAQQALASPQLAGVLATLTNGAFVDVLFRNVAGRMPTNAEHEHFTGMLQGTGGTMSHAELLVLAANSGANAVNIDLVGLQQNGLEYL